MLHSTKFRFFCLLAALSAGICCGAVWAARMGTDEIASFFAATAGNLTAQTLTKQSFLHALLKSGRAAALFFIFGTTVFGALPSLVLLGVQGYAVGISVGALVHAHGFRGFFAALGGVFPHSLIFIPCYFLMAMLGTRFSLRLMRREAGTRFFSYLVSFLVPFVCLFFGSLVEGYVSAPLLKSILQG